MLIPVDQLNDAASRFNAAQGKSGRETFSTTSEEYLHRPLSKDISGETGESNILGDAENLAKRKEMLGALSQEPLDFAFERAIGRNDSVYSNFVELIQLAKVKVGRIVMKDGSRTTGYATGFMVSENLLLTNWHVFNNKESVKESEVQFFYELDVLGNPGTPSTFKLDPVTFFHSFESLDYCLLAVNNTDTTGAVTLDKIGYIYLDPALGKLGTEGEERLNIIHHPDGDFKQLSIRENLFTKIMPFTVWYESDTAPGSSGSPVFNDQWQVVALHHSGVADKNAAGEYIDKNGEVIPVIDGKVDGARINWIANEGVRISVILTDVFASFPASPIVAKLKIAPGKTAAGAKKTSFATQHVAPDRTTGNQFAAVPGAAEQEPIMGQKTTNDQKTTTHMDNNHSGNVQISFPASLIAANGNISIHISNAAHGQLLPAANKALLADVPAIRQVLTDEELTEARKIDTEDAMDYSDCRGYVSGFLGKDIPMPLPKQAIKKFIAKLKGTDSSVLTYQHYSVIFNTVRMMPVLSAINVDGDKGKRLDKTKRGTDVWLRDNRIDYTLQLSDKYYKGSGFDRGHMSRREDANWGTTAEDALAFANLTCMYTNACPQINTLNQSSRGGLWGKLESVVLEKGAVQQRGKTAKISVFNGPVFKEDDSVFRGIQVPMEFFKIVVWPNDAGNLKATAFRLSQSSLVGDIDFEALDIDQNADFKLFQSSIRSIQQDTNIDFSDIIPFDTFGGQDNGQEAFNIQEQPKEIKSEEDVLSHIAANSHT